MTFLACVCVCVGVVALADYTCDGESRVNVYYPPLGGKC